MKPSEHLLLCLLPAGQHAEEAQDVRGISQQGLHPGCVPAHAPRTPGTHTRAHTHVCSHTRAQMCSRACTHIHVCSQACSATPHHTHAHYARRRVGSCEHAHALSCVCLYPSVLCVSVCPPSEPLSPRWSVWRSRMGPCVECLSRPLWGFPLWVFPLLFSSWGLTDMSTASPLTVGSVTKAPSSVFLLFGPCSEVQNGALSSRPRRPAVRSLHACVGHLGIPCRGVSVC